MARGVIAFAIALLAEAAMARSAQAQAVKPPANEDCLVCHSDPDTKRADGTRVVVDASTFEHSKHGPLACVDCHADLATVQDFPHAEKLAPVKCSACHGEEAAKYRDSIHSFAKEKAGLTVGAPACADCHGKHDIKGTDEQDGRVFRANIPATCGGCHKGVLTQYRAGVHGAALAREDPHAPRPAGNGEAAPVCSDCHTAHTIQRADTPAWRLSVAAECGTCHREVVESFRRTFHGKVTELGFTKVAACADCHGAHEILPASNPASTVAPTRLVETCGRCHQGANASFVKYDPHPNPRNYQRSPLMWWLSRFYTVLITACFGFFGLHSVLWFRRSWRHGTRRS